MITQPIKIFVDENEFDFERRALAQGGVFQLNSETSVSNLKAHYFETLGECGEIVKFSRSDVAYEGTLSRTLQAPGAVVASFHEAPPDVACRLLQHTKGGLMLPGGFLGPWTFRKATLSLVETVRQKEQIESAGGTLPIHLGVFAQRLPTHLFFSDNGKEVTDHGMDWGGCDSEWRLVYAGRLIPNKGISQLIRALNLWPIRKVKLTLVGSYEPDFFISQAGVNCPHFEAWFTREILDRNRKLAISRISPVPQTKLADIFRSSDAFICPSFHEDEASGNAAHEAVLCGLPAIVTDWCGLGQLGRNNRGGALATYPTLGGVRFSLYALRRQIKKVLISETAVAPREVDKDKEWVWSTYDPNWMKDSLQKALDFLIEKPAEPPLPGGWRCSARLKWIKRNGPNLFREALSVSVDSIPDGLYVAGTGYENDDYSEAHFLAAIQGLYTTWPKPPRLRTGVLLHGRATEYPLIMRVCRCWDED
jgi:glycosyltransferase involved in cell wall biosynthesis